MRTYILPEEQRKAIQEYLRDRPNLMPDSVRQARVRSQQIDYEQMRNDLLLLEALAGLDLKMGRKKLGHKDQRADFSVRHKKDREVKAELNLRS